jgi:hypothetical protein
VLSVPRVGQVHLFYRARLLSDVFDPGHETIEARLFRRTRSPGTRSPSRPCAKRWSAISRTGAAAASRCTTSRSPSLLGPIGFDLLLPLLVAQPDAERERVVLGLLHSVCRHIGLAMKLRSLQVSAGDTRREAEGGGGSHVHSWRGSRGGLRRSRGSDGGRRDRGATGAEEAAEALRAGAAMGLEAANGSSAGRPGRRSCGPAAVPDATATAGVTGAVGAAAGTRCGAALLRRRRSDGRVLRRLRPPGPRPEPGGWRTRRRRRAPRRRGREGGDRDFPWRAVRQQPSVRRRCIGQQHQQACRGGTAAGAWVVPAWQPARRRAAAWCRASAGPVGSRVASSS